MSGLVPALAWALVHSLWQLTLVGLLAALLLWAVGLSRPKTYHAVAFGALVACLLMPVLTFLHGLAPSPGLELAQPIPALELASAASTGSLASRPATWAEHALGLLGAHPGWLAGAWALGVLAMAIRMGGGWLTTRQWRREATAAPGPWEARLGELARSLGLRCQVRLLASTRVVTPVVLGLWRPVVLVPAALFTQLPEAYLEALLVHELAHVARFDYGLNLLQGVVEVLCFHHPVVWWLSRRIRTVREHLCDDLAAQALGEPRRLALALDALDDVQPLLNPLNPMALAAHGGPLHQRIQRLLRPSAVSGVPSWALAPILALMLPCAALAFQGKLPEAQPIQVSPETIAQLDALAAREGIDPQLLRSMAWAESGFNPGAKSPLGALGLLQVMPATARRYGAVELSDPEQVAAAGARYLKHLLVRYPDSLAKAVTAYNCGEEALDGGQAGPEATSYARLVMELLGSRAVQPAKPLSQGCVDGTFRQNGDGETWTLTLRISYRNACTLELLPDPAAGPEAKPYARVMVGFKDAQPGLWSESKPKLVVKLPKGATIRVRCRDEVEHLTGETQVTLGSAWKAFAFPMATGS